MRQFSYLFTVAAMLLGLAVPAGAQAPAVNFEIRGKIVEEKSGEPIERASVTLRAKGSTAVLSGAIAAANGEFRLQGLRPGVYALRVTYLGFAPKLHDPRPQPPR